MYFELLGPIENAETFATGREIREFARLNRVYRAAKWRKGKGFARILLGDGSTHLAGLHWYEASGIGRKELKIKRLIEEL